jgi:hypothetical protein
MVNKTLVRVGRVKGLGSTGSFTSWNMQVGEGRSSIVVLHLPARAVPVLGLATGINLLGLASSDLYL